MKKIIYFLISTAICAGIIACDKQISSDKNSKTMTISIMPKLEMDIDVRSVELGKTDIWCYVFDWDTKLQVEGSPVKQSEINGNIYSYQIPKCENAYVHFVIKPENSVWIDKYLTYNEMVIDCNDTFVTTTKTEIYASNRNRWEGESYGILVNSADSGTDIYTINMNQLHRRLHVMFTFTNMPEGITTENLIKKVHLSVGDIELDETLDPADMTIENAPLSEWDSTLQKWYSTDIYLYFGYDYRQVNSNRYIDLLIETTDNRIYSAKNIYYNYSYNENLKIIIDYNNITNTTE